MNQVNENETQRKLEEEIDLKEVFNSIYRKKFYLLGITSISLLLGVVYAFTSKPIWEGHFQIVMRSQDNKSSETNSSKLGNLSSLAGFGSLQQGNDLLTEVKILESPSILKPIYDFVKSSKIESGLNPSKWNFYNWRENNLDIKLEGQTTVLNLIYRDTDKSIVIPVMNKISKTYKEYSKSERRKEIAQGLVFLENQIEELKFKSSNSQVKLQNFSQKHGLGNLDGLPLAIENTTKIPGKDSSGISSTLNQDFETKSRYENQYEELSKLETQLLQSSTILKPDSNTIISLKKKINTFKSSLSRPAEVLIKYRKLRNNAIRDEQLLLELKDKQSTLKLEEAKQNDSWRIISQPTLLDDPVAPRKKHIVAFSLLLGVFTGCIISLVIDKFSDKLYSFNSIKGIVKFPLLKALYLSSEKLDNDIILLSNIIKDKDYKSLVIFPIGEFPHTKYLEVLCKSLEKEILNANILISTDLINISNDSNYLLVLTPGSCTNAQLNQTQEDLLIQKAKIAGWVFIDE